MGSIRSNDTDFFSLLSQPIGIVLHCQRDTVHDGREIIVEESNHICYVIVFFDTFCRQKCAKVRNFYDIGKKKWLLQYTLRVKAKQLCKKCCCSEAIVF